MPRVNWIVSPLTLPLYTIVMVLPPRSNVCVNEMLSPSTLPSLISESPRGVVTVPVSVLPSTLNVKVTSCVLPPLPGIWAVHLPLASAASAVVTIRQASRVSDAKYANFLITAMMKLEDQMLPADSSKELPECHKPKKTPRLNKHLHKRSPIRHQLSASGWHFRP